MTPTIQGAFAFSTRARTQHWSWGQVTSRRFAGTWQRRRPRLLLRPQCDRRGAAVRAIELALVAVGERPAVQALDAVDGEPRFDPRRPARQPHAHVAALLLGAIDGADADMPHVHRAAQFALRVALPREVGFQLPFAQPAGVA